jgi:hypothetical protein
VKPSRRRQGLVVTELEGEFLVYDLEAHRAHCLNATAAHVFRRCDGRTSVPSIAESLPKGGARAREAAVWLALQKLDRAGLLEEAVGGDNVAAAGPSRREVLRRAAVLSGLLLPAITSAVAPTPAEAAATCVTSCVGRPFGTLCSSTAPTNCNCTCDGAGNCVGPC